ncbi:tyrosine-type recombinase/integrase [Bacillus sp. FJAT-45350]|uniref:tyrosine-type recombinase/integrase n=1 Tax=Bacillus sp. FJAT-45350 TaxID=2011014 RepID=UPI000BB82B61|nr:tyrosine-type recombinase/integrase [Bacillus sp. FJAT-45350]
MNIKCAGTTEEILDLFANYLYQKGRSENTIKTYCGAIHSFCNWLTEQKKDIKLINNVDVQSYIDYLEVEGRSTSTINKIYNAIKIFDATFQLEITKDIRRVKKVDTERNSEFLTKYDIEKLLINVKKSRNKRNIAMVYTFLETGIRVSEFCKLNKSDVQFNSNGYTGQLTVVNSKGHGYRTLPLTQTVVGYLKSYLETRDDDNESLFLSGYNKRIATRTVQHTLKQYDLTPHMLRHTYCYDLVQKGVDLSIVAQLAGHVNTTITKQYVS